MPMHRAPESRGATLLLVPPRWRRSHLPPLSLPFIATIKKVSAPTTARPFPTPLLPRVQIRRSNQPTRILKREISDPNPPKSPPSTLGSLRSDEFLVPPEMAPAPVRLLVPLFLLVLGNPSVYFCPRMVFGLSEGELGPFSIVSSWHDYSPPSPPPPSAPTPPSSSCEEDLGGAGSFDTLCQLKNSVNLSADMYVEGKGGFTIFPGVILSCPIPGCSFTANLSGEVRIERDARIIAGTVVLMGSNMSLAEGSLLNTTAMAGDPPPQTSGSPTGTNGDGGGHGGRGASCVVKEGQTPEDSWGGDAYSWSSLMKPNSYGSRGGTTSREKDYGGGGGGVIWIKVKDVLVVDGIISADGGDGGSKGGGGSGGSIYIVKNKM